MADPNIAAQYSENTRTIQGRRYERGIWPSDSTPSTGITPSVVAIEQSVDEAEITQHPIDSNAYTTDHIFLKPPKVTVGFGVAPEEGKTLSDVWRKLLDWQTKAIPLSIQTGKRLYQNMILVGLASTTEIETESVIWFDAQFVQLSIVQLVTGDLPPKARQRFPAKTATREVAGQKQVQEDPTKKSAAFSVAGFDTKAAKDKFSDLIQQTGLSGDDVFSVFKGK